MSLICLFYFSSSIFLKPHRSTRSPFLWHNYISYFSHLTSRFRIVLLVCMNFDSPASGGKLHCLFLIKRPVFKLLRTEMVKC